MASKQYKAQSARDAQSSGYGDERYWDYLEKYAREMHDLLVSMGDEASAKKMLSRSLADSLKGNDGD